MQEEVTQKTRTNYYGLIENEVEYITWAELVKNLVRGLYENLMLGLLSERQYRQLMKQYDVEQTDLETKMDAIKSALAEEREKSGDIKQFIALIRKCKNPTEISDLMFYELIDKIVVYEAEGVSRAEPKRLIFTSTMLGRSTSTTRRMKLPRYRHRKHRQRLNGCKSSAQGRKPAGRSARLKGLQQTAVSL